MTKKKKFNGKFQIDIGEHNLYIRAVILNEMKQYAIEIINLFKKIL